MNSAVAHGNRAERRTAGAEALWASVAELRALVPDAPAAVVDLDLDRPGELRAPGGGPVRPDGRVLALIRRQGRPLGLLTGTADRREPQLLASELAAEGERIGTPRETWAAPADGPLVSVVVCTRDREGMLRQCLDSLLRNGYPHVEYLIVDNAPTGRAVEELVDGRDPGRVRYLREPVPGLARARNRGLAAARGELIAFTDDDALTDTGWAAAFAARFAADPAIGCVTGLVLPAELDTPAQVAFERYCGYSRGFAPAAWRLDRPPVDDPLFPFTVSRCGTGANMAFRTRLLRRLGGFEPAIGAGSPGRGGEDLLAFLRVLRAGATLAYQPDALVWHRHRRTERELADQIHNFGTGFGAYLTAAAVRHPALLPALAARLPRGARQAMRRGDDQAARHQDPALAALGRRELLGLLHGPAGYLRGARERRRTGEGAEP
ncbi:glycosyltransferase family 2 protein [Streptomyces sp. TLI_171]|uniref:glycosyltransferase family 2 protein n=1 Tax=Streptomyces sp. TLI_171 TaxID=1938859 RepID=UPI000C19B97B|nr:glycosyltransferase [Streptomyces sp. TLI_171]RKE22617.1 glycosyl transferase family 2 [Streptomyces sp. TLI_171]